MERVVFRGANQMTLDEWAVSIVWSFAIAMKGGDVAMPCKQTMAKI
jgi:hypothetical protein